MEHHQEKKNLPPFHPVFEGCVVRDPCMANAVGESYLEELYAIVSYNYRTTIARGCNKPLAELFDRIAKEEMRHFRILGELILSLGGNPAVCTHLRIGVSDAIPMGRGSAGAAARMIADSLCEERRGIDRYQTLMGCTRDRVVRSVLAQILDDEQRHVEALLRAQKENC